MAKLLVYRMYRVPLVSFKFLTTGEQWAVTAVHQVGMSGIDPRGDHTSEITWDGTASNCYYKDTFSF